MEDQLGYEKLMRWVRSKSLKYKIWLLENGEARLSVDDVSKRRNCRCYIIVDLDDKPNDIEELRDYLRFRLEEAILEFELYIRENKKFPYRLVV